MRAFLPYLVRTGLFVLLFQEFKLVQQPTPSCTFCSRKNFFRRIAFERLHYPPKFRCFGQKMYMTIHNDISEQAKIFMRLAETQRIDNDVACFMRRENGNPFDDGGGEEIDAI